MARRLPDSDADRRYAIIDDFCSGFDDCCTLDFGCFIVEMRSGTWARDDDFVTLPGED